MSQLRITSKPLNGITLGQAISDYNNQMIILSTIHFPLNEANIRKILVKTKLMYYTIDNIIHDPIKRRPHYLLNFLIV
jgi:hypothetical protein